MGTLRTSSPTVGCSFGVVPMRGVPIHSTCLTSVSLDQLGQESAARWAPIGREIQLQGDSSRYAMAAQQQKSFMAAEIL